MFDGQELLLFSYLITFPDLFFLIVISSAYLISQAKYLFVIILEIFMFHDSGWSSSYYEVLPPVYVNL